jgi:hypothetical protein
MAQPPFMQPRAGSEIRAAFCKQWGSLGMRANEIFEMTMVHCGQLALDLERYSAP